MYGQIGTNDAGIYLYGAANATRNVIHGNYYGVMTSGSSSSTIEENRIYDNGFVGVVASPSNRVRRNVVYSNAVGIQTLSSVYDITNNLVYDNSQQGIWLDGTLQVKVVNNTVYQPVGDAVHVTRSSNVQLRNNILQVEAGYGIYVASDSQVGFASDYNDLVTKPDGGEVWPAEQTFPVRWRSAVAPLAPDVADAGYRAAVLGDGAVGYWRLGETAGATTAVDETGSHPGTYGGTPALQQARIWTTNDAARFDGFDDVVLVPDQAALRPAQLSVEAWVWPQAGISTNDTVLMKSTSSSWTDGYGLFYDSGKIVFFVNNYSSHRVQAALGSDRWTHVVGTFDGAEIKLYLDGILVARTPYAAAIAHSTNQLRIGRSANDASYTWTGKLDEVAVYGAALSLEQVMRHFGYGSARGHVDIELLASGTPVLTIGTHVGDLGEYPWYIPAATTPGTDYRIRVTRRSDASLMDQSNSAFTISEPITEY